MNTWHRLWPNDVVAIRRRRTLLALGLCAFVAVASLAVPLAWNTSGRNGPCADLDLHEGRLDRAVPLEQRAESGEQVWLCLVHEPNADLYGVELTPVHTSEQFRAAKNQAANKLRTTGFDPCLVTWWINTAARGTQSLDDMLDNPADCLPRIIAGDPGAEGWLPAVRAAAVQIADASRRDFDWHPTRPLTVLVVTDAETAMTAYQHYGPTGPPDAVTQWAASRVHLMQAGASGFENVSGAGSLGRVFKG